MTRVSLLDLSCVTIILAFGELIFFHCGSLKERKEEFSGERLLRTQVLRKGFVEDTSDWT